MGGAGSACLEYMASQNQRPPLLQLGLPDHFIEHGTPEQLLSQCGLDAPGITRSIQRFAEEQQLGCPSPGGTAAYQASA